MSPDDSTGQGGVVQAISTDADKATSTAMQVADWPSEVTTPGTKQRQLRQDLTGVVLDGIYKLESKFNGGGMGEIWKARHIKLDTEWLVKLLPSEFSQDSCYVDALLREAKLTANLPGGYFPSVIHTGISDGIAFYVMESIAGEDLAQLLEHQYPSGMTAAEAMPLLEQMLEAMAVAHDQGVIHRDIKPDNIFIETIAGKDARIRILDFGVAKATNEMYATLSKKLPRGTQQYMPPESHKPIPEAATAAGDVFALGLTAYQMILGRHPFAASDYVQRYEQGKELGLLHEDRTGKRAGVHADIAEVFATAVRFDPDERYPDAGAMLRALRHAKEFRPGDIPVGTVLNRSYRILGKLGAGGMGAVYDVEDIHHNIKEKQVLKILVYPPGTSAKQVDLLRERFRRECSSLYALQHPAIPYIYGNESHEGFPFLVMERAKGDHFGRTFHALLSKGGWAAVFDMARQVASALDAVHAQGIIHRDIKPSNIIIDPSTAKAAVLDFGIARLSDTHLTAADTRIGTPGFSAPEQVLGKPILASDQWSLAACFYALLTNLRPGGRAGEEGKMPRIELSLRIDERIIEGDVLPFSELKHLVTVPSSVVEAITRAMSHEPSERFSSVTAFVEALEAGVEQPTIPVLPEISTAAALSAWMGSAPPEVETPLLLSVPTPLVLATPKKSSVVAAALPTYEPEDTYAVPRRSRHTPLFALIGVLLLVGAYYGIWRKTGDSPELAQASPPAIDPPTEKTPEVAPQPAAMPLPEPAPTPTPALAEVSTSHNGKLVTGVKLQIGDSSYTSPLKLELPAGTTIVTVDTPKFQGQYPCTLSAASTGGVIELAQHTTKKRKKPRKKGSKNQEDGELLHFLEPKPP